MPEEKGKLEPEERALQLRNECVRLLEKAAEQAKIANERAPRLGKKAQLTKSPHTYYAMAAEEASDLKQTVKATDLFKTAAREAVKVREHEDAATYLVRAAEELRTDKQGRRRTEIPRLYAQAAEESAQGQRIKDAIRYLEQAIEMARSLGDNASALAMQERANIFKARIGAT